MNWVDLILILICFLSILNSVRRGFIISALELFCWVSSLVIAFLLYKPLHRFIDNYITSIGPWSAPIAFMVILLASRVFLSILESKLLERVPEKTHHLKINRLFGLVPGVIYSFLWTMIAITLFALIPITKDTAQNIKESKLSPWIIAKGDWFKDKVSPVFTDLLHLLPKENIIVNKGKSINLPFKVSNPKRRLDLEAEMLVLVNKERKKKGLKLLMADPEIAVAALKHSSDMFKRGYFSHLTPEGKTPFQRIKDEKISFITAGENLALAQTLAIAHQGLMNSPGHRANILHPAFGRLGIGILDGGIYGLMVTQNFRN